ncbi:MAG: DNA translocase FtsK 4TM domain-containing protein, partial [Bryobacterales bacterium]|nr:DNA translocase FtsK 4TM domain-containing protein [Bryobacterales bacterium]
MKILGPTRFHRLNEAGGLVCLFAGLFLVLSLVSYHPQDPSWNSVSGATHAHNLTGLAGSHIADFCFQLLGLTAFSIPVLLWLLAWKWIRSKPIQAATVKVFGSV